MTAADINAVTLRQTVIAPDQLGRAGAAFASGQGFMGVAGALGGGTRARPSIRATDSTSPPRA